MADSAPSCASSLRISDGASSPSSSEIFIASALSHLTAIGRLAEEAARLDPSLGDLSIAILAKTRKSEGTAISQFRLWPHRQLDGDVPRNDAIENRDVEAAGTSVIANPILGAQGNNRTDASDAQPNPGHSSDCHVDRIAETPDLSRRIPPLTLKQSHIPANEVQNGHRKGVTREESGNNRINGSNSLETFYVDDTYAAKCLSLLLDASGITTHPSCYRQKSFSLLQAPILRKALRSMLQELKRRYSADDMTDLKYCSIIPTELHNRQVVFSALTLMRTASGNHVINDTVKTTLSVRKPDRNRKEVNFAIFSALLQVDPGGVCSETLHEISLQGIGSSGCSAKPGKRCGGPNRCRELNISPLCEFFDDENEVVGRGEVYPSISYFQGDVVPSDMVAIRSFTACRSDSSAWSSEIFGEASTGSFHLWKIANVSRYALMDAYGVDVGSAVFAKHAASEKGRKKGIEAGDLDIEEAAVLCDVQISDKHASDSYCFSEWYKFGSSIWREVQDPSLSHSPIPQTLGDLRNFVSILWHQRHLRKLSLERLP